MTESTGAETRTAQAGQPQGLLIPGAGRHGILHWLKRTGRRLVSAVRAGLVLDLNRDPGRSILLAASGRSGSTWIGQVILARGGIREMFEPFAPNHVPIFRHFHPTQYLRPACQDPRYVEPLLRVFSGRIRNVWVDEHNRGSLFGRRLIKAVRANLFLKWVRVHLPQVRIILLLRHPCAVCGSRFRLGWDPHLPELLEQGDLLADHLGFVEKSLRNATDPFEKHVWKWCIETYVPLRQLRTGDVYLAFYEEFCTRPRQAASDLYDFLGWVPDEAVDKALARPSFQTKAHSAVLSGGDLVGGWQEWLGARQIDKTMDILSRFGLQHIYTRDPMPNVAAAQEYLGAPADAKERTVVTEGHSGRKAASSVGDGSP